MRLPKKSALVVAAAAAFGVPRVAEAQTSTFYLDRLQIPGAPDDGMVMWRPVTQPDNIFYGQLAIGFQYAPLRTNTIIQDSAIQKASSKNVIETEGTIYGSAGFELLNRIIASVNFPWNPLMTGQNPNYPSNNLKPGVTTTVIDPNGPTTDDLRIDLRGVFWRTPNLRGALGGGISIFAPSGTQSAFGGDGTTSWLLSLNAEYDFRRIVLTFDTALHLGRASAVINDPVDGNGLGVERRLDVGARRVLAVQAGQVPHRAQHLRADRHPRRPEREPHRPNVLPAQNTPVEWNVEGRMKFGPSDHWWAGATLGTLVVPGYGAPDFRVVAALGAYVPLPGSTATQTDKERREAMREKWRSEHGEDSDGDGIPDDIDACPMEKDSKDRTTAARSSPIATTTGSRTSTTSAPISPRTRTASTTATAAPRTTPTTTASPTPRTRARRNPASPTRTRRRTAARRRHVLEGSVIKFVQQVHFATGSATILPDSFPILQDVVNLLKVNPNMKRIAIEGHTDNTGSADLNRKLSQSRAESVMKWLVEHGIKQERLEAHGYGPDRPIDTNYTDAGRTKNRRVEFKILEQTDSNQAQKK